LHSPKSAAGLLRNALQEWSALRSMRDGLRKHALGENDFAAGSASRSEDAALALLLA